MEAAFGSCQLDGDPSQLELMPGLTGEHPQGNLLAVGQPATGLGVDHAHGAERGAVARPQRSAGVEPDVRVAHDEGVVHEARIELCVGDDHHGVGVSDRPIAEGGAAGGFFDREPEAGLEPLAIAVDEGHQRNGGVEQVRREPHEVVEGLLGWCIEDVVGAELRQPFRLDPR